MSINRMDRIDSGLSAGAAKAASSIYPANPVHPVPF